MAERLVIRVDRTVCAGHAMCNACAPHLFPVDDEGYSIADGKLVPEGDEALARRGARACPERAIRLEEGTT